jgi:hypothetical protein
MRREKNYNRKNPLENETIQTGTPLNSPDLSLTVSNKKKRKKKIR